MHMQWVIWICSAVELIPEFPAFQRMFNFTISQHFLLRMIMKLSQIIIRNKAFIFLNVDISIALTNLSIHQDFYFSFPDDQGFPSFGIFSLKWEYMNIHTQTTTLFWEFQSFPESLISQFLSNFCWARRQKIKPDDNESKLDITLYSHNRSQRQIWAHPDFSFHFSDGQGFPKFGIFSSRWEW